MECLKTKTAHHYIRLKKWVYIKEVIVMIQLISEEYLEEMSTIYKSKEYGIGVSVNPDSKRSGNPYFKFYNSSDYLSATKIIRIMFNKPDYIIHNNGKELWKLNSKEKKLLMDVLHMPSKRYRGRTNWEAAKFDWNYEYLEEMIDIDEYFNGDYDELYKNNPGYVNSTLSIPNYTNLKF
jgi:hypothetical protein